MNLRQELGQRFIFSLVDVTYLSAEVADFLVQCQAGGVILYGFNIQSPGQVARLTRDLQDLARQHGLPPFIISIDEEGGQVSRMPAQSSNLITPSQMAQAVAGPQAVTDCAEVTARWLRRLGFNLNYAPVLDINSNPVNPVIGTRSYGSKPEEVARLGKLAIEAYLKNDLSPCVKHFPGHGDTDVDSHLNLPIVNKTLDELRQFELIPFEAAIGAGVPAIMTSHILYPQVKADDLPATLSPFFLNELLRGELKYEGLIVSDALDMRAIADYYGLGPATLLAFEAGVDAVLLKGTLQEQLAAFEGVVTAFEGGQLSQAQAAHRQSLQRLTDWKKRFCLPVVAESTSDDANLIARTARQTLSLFNSNEGHLPLTPDRAKRPLLIDFTADIVSPVEEGRLPGPILEQHLQKGLPTLLRLAVPVEPTENDTARVTAWATQSDLLIIVLRNALRYGRQARLVQQLISQDTPVILIAAREPYDLSLFPDSLTSIATYGDPPATLVALAELLVG